MPFLKRRDGEFVSDAPVLRHFLPYIMPKRNEAIVYLDLDIDLTATREFLTSRNANSESPKTSLLHLILCAFVKTAAARPEMNRFIVGKRLYQRYNIEISFAVKKKFDDSSPITTVKITFEPNSTLDKVIQQVEEAIHVGRGDAETTSEKEMRLLSRLPRFVLEYIFKGQRWLDYFNLLPHSMIKNDPLYASVFLANLGSIGLAAPYHHLYEYGTVSLFCAIGESKKVPVVVEDSSVAIREVLPLRFSYDERIADGYYCARSLDIFKEYMENPTKLLAISDATQ